MLGHANNVVYVRWLQDAAVAHSEAQGWPGKRHLAMGSGWVARSHYIEYLEPARLEDAIVVQTWVAGFKRVTSVRRYRIYRADDACLLARAETHWAYVTYATGKPCRIPDEVANAFVLAGEEVPPYRPDEEPMPPVKMVVQGVDAGTTVSDREGSGVDGPI